MNCVLNYYDSVHKKPPTLFSLKPTGTFLRYIEDASDNPAIFPKIIFLSETEAKIILGENEFSIRLTSIDHTVSLCVHSYGVKSYSL